MTALEYLARRRLIAQRGKGIKISRIQRARWAQAREQSGEGEQIYESAGNPDEDLQDLPDGL